MSTTSMDPELAEYERLAAELNPAPKASRAEVDPLETQPLAELLEDPAVLAPAEWIVRPLFERGTLSVIYGPGKIGKSTMLADIAGHVIAGRDWAGQSVTGGPVLWVDLEQGRRRLARTFGSMDRTLAGQLHVWSDLSARPDLSRVWRTIETLQPALVVMDSLAKLCQVEEENDNAAWQRALQPLEAMARANRAAVVVIDHDRKGEGEHGRALRGASSKLAAFDAAIHLKRANTPTGRRLEMVSREVGDFTLTVDRTADGYRATSGVTAECRVLAALRSLGDAVTVKVLHHHLERQGFTVSNKTVAARLSDAVENGHATVSGTGTKNDPKVYAAVARVVLPVPFAA
ncbi:AAA family ATPase [Gemmatimonas sp.]|uniref:AAA family ATPase n=1 Tax=Gemmatimonas sp. TaxID=1962908 RepID=UPI0025B913E3|nr:AAA family ATPase [Gemmatimonas sp.]MCA2983405.1 AAA family ATPase [Gemmatimonas sp.]MCA2996143.1 AAA family ATPase [Gemmatimonas sp.]